VMIEVMPNEQHSTSCDIMPAIDGESFKR